ncbi:hypothetical protein N0V86_003906 [Didymella sp. IMI 355093]|nr:hypothetical protein N0V86_003906 [Didymella sp. IMI 355093]
MDISSGLKPTTVTKDQVPEHNPPQTSSAKDLPDSSRLREDSAQEEEARSSQAAQYAQIEATAETPTSILKYSNAISPEAQMPYPYHAQSFDSLVPATTYKMPSTVQVPQSSPTRETARVGSHSETSSEAIERSAKRLVSSMPKSTLEQKLASVDRTLAKGSGMREKQRHDRVASPAPASSTGFMYRIVGQPKNGIGNLPRTKPRAVSFGSSSPSRKKARDPSAVALETTAPVTEVEVLADSSSKIATDATEAYDVQQREEEAEAEEEEQHKDDQQESYKSRQSQYSTQAAMLLAQLEFQENSSQSSTSSATLRPWSQPAQNTPRVLLPQPSPAITPLSVFNARTDLSFSDLAGNSVLDGSPISTQDLFNAASPFAFSTVKKKSQRPRRSSMLFALTKLNESMVVTSPTPLAERVPHKEKNTSTMWSFAHENLSMNSPESTSQSLQRTTNDVELPQLDFHTSLDFGPNADFTDYFLKGLNNEP